MMHPLLVDAAGSSSTPAGQTRGLYRRSQRGVVSGSTYGDLLHTIEDIVGGGAMQLFQQLMSRTRGGMGADIRVEVPTAGIIANSERGHLQRHGRTPIAASVRLDRDPRSGDGRPESFTPLPTLQRWTEEAKISHGKFLQERLSKLCNHITLSLLPEARDAAQKAKEKEEKEREEREVAAAKATELAAAAAQASEGAKEEAETEEHSGGDEGDPVEGASQEAVPPVKAIDEDTEMIDLAQSASGGEPGTDETPPLSLPSTEIHNSNDLSEDLPHISPSQPSESSRESTSNPAEAESGSNAEVSSGPDRVTVTIHGNPVDITDTGIDPTFLEALPDDMREEVLNQHFRERRTARVEQPPESQISPEFLDALPPEIRAEILQQERLERSRRERTQDPLPTGGAAGGDPTGPAEIDPASFIASLEPQLRQVVLLDQDEVFLQSLPSHMIAEAGVYRDGSHVPHHIRRDAVPPTTVSQPQRKGPAPRDAIQLLDRSAIATLVRLLFFPQLLRKNVLHKVLLNLCENSKSRTDVFNLLLNILQDGTGDLGMVDRSFAQMSFRSSKANPQTTPKAAGKQRSGLDFPISGVSLSHLPGGIPPDLIAQRCLDALTFIVGANEMSSLFFLTEHELPAGLKRTASKKGKGKEKQTAQSHYPIVLLLGLLDRQTLLKTPSIMDAVAGLLAAVTRPLMSLKDEKIKAADSTSLEPSTDAAATSSMQTQAVLATPNTTSAGKSQLSDSRPCD